MQRPDEAIEFWRRNHDHHRFLPPLLDWIDHLEAEHARHPLGVVEDE